MKKIRAVLSGMAVLFVVIAAGLISTSPAIAGTCSQWAAKAVSVQGIVEAKRSGEAEWQAVHMNDTYCQGDSVRVQERSRADMLLANDVVLRLDQKTSVTISGAEKGKTHIIDLLNGAAHFFSRFRRSLTVITPFVNATVEGTEFLVKVETDKTLLSIYEGQVSAVNDSGSLMVASGQSAVAEKGKAPVISTVAHPRDAVQWTLYYPHVFPYQPSKYEAGADWRAKVSYLLSAGRVDEAGAELEQTLKASPGNSDALAIQSVIALAQNDKEKAFGLAKRAVDANPKSASARIALSYALNARFDTKGALENLKEAVKSEPENAMAWARLSEMHLAMGEVGEALKAAEKSVSLNPNLARTQTVLGFARLSEIKTKLAKENFEKAIQLDQADPLPRLGLGLAKIREGNLVEGRSEIEIAETLDPQNSIVRSYLGKAYYDEKRDEKASEQFVKAEEFDPNDPTPWFYDAIRKQSINRPVEALHDLQKSIELNDNRAVYRSKLLLDSDLAARSASLSAIYSDLGFQQLAFEEAAKSVNTDPANYSAHRFLSDSYSVLPRHEIARVSELLQSQLLQPININPIRPDAAESQLFILEGAGPSNSSFNEFNPLFNRNRLALQLSGIAGGNSTWGDEVVVSGVYNNFSMSAGQFHYETNGFRENNDLKEDIYNVFAQYSLSEDTSVQAEYRHKNINEGDLELRFDPNNFNPTLRQKEQIDTIRFGLHHSFAPGSEIMASLIYQNADSVADVIPGFFNLKGDLNNYVGEVRYLYRAGAVYVTGGVGHRQLDQKLTTIFAGVPSEENLTNQFTNVYLYAQIDLLKNLNLTVGGSGDFLTGAYEGEGRNEFNPKFGLTWQALPNTTFRAAVFRTLQRPFISNEDIDPSLEPTEIAGFNQLFFGATGEEAWRYGVAADHRISSAIYAGAELSARDIDTKIIDVTGPTPIVISRDWKEKMGRVFVNWTPTSRIAVSAEYIYEWFSRPAEGGFTGAEQFAKLRTHRVPLSVKYFHPTGVSASIKATYVKQQGDFTVPSESGFLVVPGKDDFWVFDASISYRLPKRLGIVSLEAKNLFDEKFRFQDTDPGNPRIFPKSLILAKLTLAF